MKKQGILTLTALLLFATPAFAQGWNVDLLSETYESWSSVMYIAKQGNYVYLGLEYNGLSIVDVSNPNSPREVALTLQDCDVCDIEVSGNYAYISISGGLRILDITNPANPFEVAQLVPPLSGGYNCVSGNLLYVINSIGLNVLDVSNPTNPVLIGQYPFPTYASDPTAVGNYLYVPKWSGGLWILDVTDPANPSLAGSISGLWGNSYDLAVSGDVVYLPLTTSGLYSIDVSDPTNPTVLDHLSGVDLDAVEVSGDLVYVGTSGYGMFIVNAAQPANLSMLGNYPGPGQNSALRNMVVSDSYVYGAWDSNHFRITDVSNPQNPTNLSSYYTDWNFVDIAWQDNYAFIVDYNHGLLVSDVSDPAHPWQVATLDNLGHTHNIALWGDYAYLPTDPSGTKIVNVADPTHPTLVGSLTPQLFIRKIVEGLAYSNTNLNLQILDLSQPLSPVQIGTYSLPGGGIDELDTDGRTLYAVANFIYDYSSLDSLLVLDVNDPANPQFLGLYPLHGSGHKLALGDGFLYVWGYDCGFRVFDVSDPTQPLQVGHLGTTLAPSKMLVSGSAVFLCCVGTVVSGPRIIDVSDPTNPVLSGSYMAPAYSNQKMAVHNNHAYVTEGEHFAIYDCSDAVHNEIALTLTPFTLPIQIPASGGSFDYYLFAENAGLDPQAVDLWCRVILPDGSVISPLLGPISAVLNTGTVGWVRHQSVPAWAPAGAYTYVAMAGVYPYTVWDADTLVFEKLTTGDGPLVDDWSNSGEPFPGEVAVSAEVQPLSFSLYPCHPNPFNASAVASYQLQAAGHVSLKVYDTAGRLVATLAEGWREAGEHSVTFDGSKLVSGVYLARLSAGDCTNVQKLILLK
jgi:hypothetical protein